VTCCECFSDPINHWRRVVHGTGNSTNRASLRRAQRVFGELELKEEGTAIFFDCLGGGSGLRDDHASSARPRPPSLRTHKSRHAKKRARELRRHFVARHVGGAGHQSRSWRFLVSKRRFVPLPPQSESRAHPVPPLSYYIPCPQNAARAHPASAATAKPGTQRRLALSLKLPPMCLFRSHSPHSGTITAPAQRAAVHSAASLMAGKQRLALAPSNKRVAGSGCMQERAGGIRAHSGRRRIGVTERSELSMADQLDAFQSRADADESRQRRLQPPARRSAAFLRQAYRW